MRVVVWVGRQLLPFAVAGLVVLLVLGDAAAQASPPGAPAVPTVAVGDGALLVSWAAPASPGSAAIAAYDIRYILTSADETDDANWSVVEDIWTGAGSLAYTLIGLSNGARHDVQVRAVSPAGDGDWSPITAASPADHGNSRDAATAITLGAPVVGSIADSTDGDFFSFSLSEPSDIFIYTTSYLAGFLATTGELQDSLGSVVTTDDGTSLYRPHGQQLFLWGSLGAGDYHVRVSAAGAGTYTLHTELVKESTGLTDAGPLAMGGEANGILTTATEDVDYFRLEAAEATSVLLRLARTGQPDLRGELLDSAGGEIAAQDDSFLSGSLTPEFFLPLSLEAGVYYLRVSGSPGGEFVLCNGDSLAGARENGDDCSDPLPKPANTGTGPYTVSAEVIPEAGTDFAHARALQLGSDRATAGVIESPGDAHYYSLTVSEPTYITIEARSKDLHPEGALYRPDQTATGGALDTAYVLGELGFRLEATLASGTSYLTVEARDGSSTGGYIVRVAEDKAYREFIDACTGLSTSVTDPLYGCQWHLNNTGRNAGAAAGEDINVSEVWSGGNLGAEVSIAIVDDGIHAGHVDLTDSVDAARNHDYTGNGAAHTPPHAHGTQMAGIVAARGNALGVRGVAPQARVYGYNLALDPTLANMADATTREMATTAVSLNGWGLADGPGLDFAGALWEAAVESGISSGFGGNGVFYVFPAGNGAQLGDHANLSEFANHHGVTAVCAVNDQGVRAGYSERGDNLWVCGPSSGSPRNPRPGIATTEPYDRYTQEAGGTGAAAAAVAGVAALVRKANPALTWRDVKLILAASARKNAPTAPGWSMGALKHGSTTERYNFNRSYGFGVVDAKAAVDLAVGWTAPPPLRTVEAASDGNLDLAIPRSAAYAESTVSVGPGVEFVEFVEVEAVMRHPAFRDVDIELVSPSGAVSRLAEYGASAPPEAIRGGVRLGTARHLGEDPSGTWTLRIRDRAAGNDGVLLSWSLTIHGHGRPTDLPVITAANPASTVLRVTWTIDDAAGVTAYDVRHIASSATNKGDSNWTVKDDAWTAASGALSYTISGLTDGTSYDVQVRAVRNTTDGSWSETAVGTPATAATAAPSITTVRAEERALRVSWRAPTTPPAMVTGYGVRHIRSDAADKAADANWTVVSAATTSASARTHTVTGLTNDVGYDVQVRAVTANGNGAWSATATGLPADFPNDLAQAPTIPLNWPIHGHLTGNGDRDWFRLNIGTAAELVVHTTGDADTRGYLRNSTNGTRFSNDDSDHDDATLNFKIIRAVGTGTWYLEIRDFSRIGGDYVLRVESRTESTGTSSAPTLSLGGAYEAALDSSSDVDYYKLVIGSSTDVILRSSGPTNTKGTLLQSNGTTAITSNGTGRLVEGNFDLKGNTNFLIRRTLSAATYYLKVEHERGSAGHYTVHASAASSPGTSRSAAAALTLDVAGAGSIGSATDADFFSFTLTEPRTVGVTAAGSPAASTGDLLIQGELQDAGGAKLRDYARYRADREVGFRDIHRLDAGTYHIKVTGSTSASREKYVVLVYTFDEHDRRGAKCAGGEPRFTDPLANCQWHLHHPGLPDIDVVDLNMQDVWDSYKGNGINVAVVDNSMEYTHPDLSPNVNASLNHSYVAGETIEDLTGFFGDIPPHGTSVAGIIAAAENGIGVSGVAPMATIYAYNVVKQASDTNEADAMTRNMNITAISNNSWGPRDNGFTQAAGAIWKRAIDRGVTAGNGGKGISYIWAAGNGGRPRQNDTVIDYANLDEYANYWGVTAVGEHDIFGNKTESSEAGAVIWVTAPGVWETAPEWWAARVPNLVPGYPRAAVTTTDGGYAYRSNFSGTSAAAPMAAGVIALMREANPALTWRDVKLILAETSRKVQPDHPRWVTGAPVYLTPGTRYSHSQENGFGALDAKAAVERALAWTNVPALHKLDTGWQTHEAAPIPNDDGATSLELTFTIEEEIPFIEFIQIPMAMNHDYFRELQIELVSPSGVVAVVQRSVVINRDYRNYVWPGHVHNFGDAVHLGESTKGVWTLRITDPSSQTDFVSGSDPLKTTSGTFSKWKLQFYGHGQMPGRPEFPDTGAVTAGTRSLTVNWTAPAVTGATAITRYDLRHSIDGGASWAVLEDIWQSGDLTHTLTGLASAVEHMVQVRAVNSYGTGLWSQSAEGTPMVPALAAPAIALVTPSDASLGVVWTAPAGALPGEITSYDLRHILTSADENADSNWTEATGAWSSGPLHYLQAGLVNASQYDVQVRAVNGSADPPVNGAWSATTTGTPAATIDVEVAWVTAATSVAESAGTVTLQASMVTKEAGTLPSAFSMPVKVVVSGPTITSADFSLASDTLTFVFADFSPSTIGGQSRYRAVKDIVITIANDDVDELDEVMTVALDYPGLVLPHQQGGGATVPVTITSDDEGPVRIGWEDAEVRVDESAGTVTLRAFAVTTQDAAPSAGYALHTTITTIAGAAVRSSSFTPVTRRITLGASDFAQATVDGQSRYRATVDITLIVTDDALDEPDEEITVALAVLGPSPPGLAGSPAVARVTITDNDHVPVALSWSTASPTVAEADGTLVLMAQVTTTVDKAPESGFTVPLTVATADGTATQPSDYTPVSENFSFSTGDFTQVTVGGEQRYSAARDISVSVLGDTTDEPGETFTVALAYGATASHLTGSSAIANVILTDSNQPEVTLEWNETAETAAEPDTAGGTTTVTLTAVATTMGPFAPDPGFDLDFTLATADGTATQPADYTGPSTSGSFDETDFSSVMVAGNPRYRATMDFTVSVADDTIDEPDETLSVTLALSDASLTYLLLGDAVATVTITDNDHVPVTLSWDDDSITVDEAATTVTLTARVTTETDKAPEPGFAVNLSVASANGTATVGTDYTAVAESYSYTPSDFSRVMVGTVYRYRAEREFQVAVLHDTMDEPDETLTLALAYQGMDLPSHLLGGSKVATLTITDNDHVPVELSWSTAAPSVDENMGTFTLTAQVTTSKDKAPETGFTVGLSAASVNGTATAPGDFTAVSETFSFSPSDFSAVTVGGVQRYRATKDFAVAVVDDVLDEPNETFTVALAYTGAAMPHLTGGSKTASVTLVDTTQATVTLAWQSVGAAVDEPPLSGSTATVTLTAIATTAADQPPDAGFALGFTVTSADVTASAPADYTAVSRTESFAVRDFVRVSVGGATRYRATGDFTVTIVHDAVYEDNEALTMTLALSDASIPYLLLGEAVATVTIVDNCADVDIWCATGTLGSEVHGEGRYDLYTGEVDNMEFRHNGADYRLLSIAMHQNGPNAGNVVLPFGIPERTEFLIDFLNLSGPSDQAFDPPNNDWLDWTLHVYTISDGKTLTAALPFSEARKLAGAWWRWSGGDIDDLRRAWKADQPYRLRLVGDPRSGRTPQPLNPPLYLRVQGEVNTTQTWLRWLTPQTRHDRVPPVDSYRIQWKQSSGSWDMASDVSETTRGPSRQRPVSHFLEGLTPGVEYNIRVIATDSAGDSEPSNEVTYTKPAEAQLALSNSPAEGEPRIDGIPEAGQTLSADTTGISDVDGLEEATFQYQWITDDADIAGATGSTYTLTSEHLGQAIRVRVAFTDDGGNEETLTSEPTVVPAGLQLQAATVDDTTLTLTYNEELDTSVSPPKAAFAVNVNGSSRSLSGVAVGQSSVLLLLSQAVEAGDTVTVDYTVPGGPGFIRDIRGRRAASFSEQAVTNGTASARAPRQVEPQDKSNRLTASVSGEPSFHDGQTAFTFELRFGEDPKPDFSYTTVRDHAFTVARGSVTYVRRLVPPSNIGWEVHVTPDGNGDVNLSLRSTTDCSAQGAICTGEGRKLSGGLQLAVAGPNTPATGAPTISGTAQVGETLTANTSSISDADGMTNAAFTYQWVADADEINGAIASSYTLAADDEGKAITVRVSFTDDRGNGETLTSTATVAVAAAPPPNTPATGAPTISGAAQVGESLTADTTSIADADGLDNATFTYQWMADDVNIQGATGSTYTLGDSDAGKAIKVKVSFTDDRNNAETLTSEITEAVAERPNTPGAGGPSIQGVLKDGEELAADTVGIADADGLTNATISYQWMRVDGGTPSDIPGQTASTYTLTAADVGKGIQLRVSFTDDRNNAESLTSAVTDAVIASGATRRLLWLSTLTVADAHGEGALFGFVDSLDVGRLSPDAFTESGTTYSVAALTKSFVENAPLAFVLSPTPTTEQTAAWRLVVHNTELALADAVSFEISVDPPVTSYDWDVTALTVNNRNLWGDGDEVTVSLQVAVNVSATGAPTISGTPQVGETLTSSTTDIGDDDGLSGATFNYQWLADDAEIDNATAGSYTLVDADAGKAVKVKVTFTDDRSNAESLTSEATEAVAARPNTPAAGAPTISGTPQVGETLTAGTTGISDTDGLTNAAFTYQWVADDTDIDGATGPTYTLADDAEGKTIKVKVTFTDDRSNAESLTSEATEAVAAAPPPLTISLENNPATHNGTDVFTFEIRFSEEFPLSYVTLRDHAFTVTRGTVVGARRLDRSSNIRWEISVSPDSNGDVTVVLPATTDCEADSAICTEDGRMLSNSLSYTVSGPDQ